MDPCPPRSRKVASNFRLSRNATANSPLRTRSPAGSGGTDYPVCPHNRASWREETVSKITGKGRRVYGTVAIGRNPPARSPARFKPASFEGWPSSSSLDFAMSARGHFQGSNPFHTHAPCWATEVSCPRSPPSSCAEASATPPTCTPSVPSPSSLPQPFTAVLPSRPPPAPRLHHPPNQPQTQSLRTPISSLLKNIQWLPSACRIHPNSLAWHPVSFLIWL